MRPGTQASDGSNFAHCPIHTSTLRDRTRQYGRLILESQKEDGQRKGEARKMGSCLWLAWFNTQPS